MNQHPEHNNQVALFQWAAMQEMAYPELRWMHSIPNAVSIHLSSRQGKWAKDEGKKRGVWDIFLPAKRENFGGLYVEMKHGKNKLTPEQEQFREALKNDFAFYVAYDWIEAKIAILNYLAEVKF